ncbi:MAG: S-layer homology domain-containing protein [Eubacteriales bacterium]|nr:S-layer homology domain-containing protein [Eubacteriales bacterium]
MAAIIFRYAKFKGYDVQIGENTNILSYEDSTDISEYVIPALQYTAGSGIMLGKTDKTLNPKDTATRAETAAVIIRLLDTIE